jgi:hypothetical protein
MATAGLTGIVQLWDVCKMELMSADIKWRGVHVPSLLFV